MAFHLKRRISESSGRLEYGCEYVIVSLQAERLMYG